MHSSFRTPAKLSPDPSRDEEDFEEVDEAKQRRRRSYQDPIAQSVSAQMAAKKM